MPDGAPQSSMRGPMKSSERPCAVSLKGSSKELAGAMRQATTLRV